MKVEDPYEEARRKEEEEEAKVKTLDEFLAGKKTTNFKKEARKAEEVKKTNIEKTEEKKHKVQTITSHLTSNDTYSAATAKSENVGLFGFQGDEQEGGNYRGRG